MRAPFFTSVFLVILGLILCLGQTSAYSSSCHAGAESLNYIKGVVIDCRDTMPIPFAIVMVYYDKGFRKWSADTADANGKFVVSINEAYSTEKPKIEVRYIGYNTKRIKLKKPLLPIEGLKIKLSVSVME